MHYPEYGLLNELKELEQKTPARHEFHVASKAIFEKLKGDKELLDLVVKFNFSDPKFLNQQWSLYNIPSLYIGETKDMILKYHVFVPLKEHTPGSGAATIHHHTNYVLTTTAVLGSSYETFIFEPDFELDEENLEAKLKIKQHLTEEQNQQSFVDAWEPHVVFNPSKLSATMIMWTMDKKRKTDGLKHNPLLKPIKQPLRKAIALLGLENRFGITAKTFQFYPENGKFKAIDEDEYFAPTRAAVGDAINRYSLQAIFAFIQRMGWRDQTFLEKMKNAQTVPRYYHEFINMMLSEEPIKDVYAKERINIPKGNFTKQDVLDAHRVLWGEFQEL